MCLLLLGLSAVYARGEAVAAEAVDNVSTFWSAGVKIVHGVDDAQRREDLGSPRRGICVRRIASEAVDWDERSLEEEVAFVVGERLAWEWHHYTGKHGNKGLDWNLKRKSWDRHLQDVPGGKPSVGSRGPELEND